MKTKSEYQIGFDQGYEQGQIDCPCWMDFIVGTIFGVVVGAMAPSAWHAVVAFFK